MKTTRKYVLLKAAILVVAVALLGLFLKLFGMYAIILPLLYVFFDVSYFLRMVWIVLRIVVLRERVELLKTSETCFCVLTPYMDLQCHMNNSRYLRECDFGRVNHWLGSGIYEACWNHGLGLVLGALTIRYRRSLELFQIVQLRTKVIYWDEKAIYLEQQFVNNKGFVCAVAIAKQSIIKRDKKMKDHLTADQLICEVIGEKIPRPCPPKELELWIDYNSASSISLRGSSQTS